MPSYQYQSSDDESTHNISLNMRQHQHTHSDKKYISYSVVHHDKKPCGRNKKIEQKKEKKKKNIVCRNKKQKKESNDFVVLGDTYYSCHSARQISQRFMQKEEQRVMDRERIQRKQKNCIKKIEKYLRTFLIVVHSRPVLNRYQKTQLYSFLKQQEQKQQKIQHFEEQLRKLITNLQHRSQQLIKISPCHVRQITRWKMLKMHQLMTAKQFVSDKKRFQIDVFDLERELEFLKEEKFFPEMRGDARELSRQIQKHLKVGMHEIAQEVNEQDQGVKWALQKLYTYISDNQTQWQQICIVLQQYSQDNHDLPLLSDKLFISFSRQQIGTSESQPQQIQRSYLHIFNKAVFDLINQTAVKVENVETSIECLKEIFRQAQNQIKKDEEWVQWRENQMLLWVVEIVEEEVFDQALGELLDFY